MISRARVHIIIIAAAIALAVVGVQAQQPAPQSKWEQVDGYVQDAQRGADGANVTVRDMHIYVDLEQPASVKLFTILGQPVSTIQLPAGTSRFRVPTRGIYILKIGSSTRRITI